MRTLAQLMEVPKKDRIVPRAHQDELVDGVVKILDESDHAYVEAPPAIGKTLVAALVADRLGHDRAYYITHTVDLVESLGVSKAEVEGDGRQLGIIDLGLHRGSRRPIGKAIAGNHVPTRP